MRLLEDVLVEIEQITANVANKYFPKYRWTADVRSLVTAEILLALRIFADNLIGVPNGVAPILCRARLEIDTQDGQPHLYLFYEGSTLAEALEVLWPIADEDYSAVREVDVPDDFEPGQ